MTPLDYLLHMAEIYDQGPLDFTLHSEAWNECSICREWEGTMIRNQIEIIMRECPEWHEATELERTAFATCMYGRQYGFEPLRDAFVWFVEGFNYRMKLKEGV